MNKVGSIEKSCKWCGSSFKCSPSHTQEFCSATCARGPEKIEPSKNAANVRKKAEALGLVKECSHCGYAKHPEILDIHHIDESRANNAWTNLTVVCPNCHKLHHLKQRTMFRSIAEMYPDAIVAPVDRIKDA